MSFPKSHPPCSLRQGLWQACEVRGATWFSLLGTGITSVNLSSNLLLTVVKIKLHFKTHMRGGGGGADM